jgi:hypothetical protein
MIVEAHRLSPSEIYQGVLRLPTSAQQHSKGQSSEPERAIFADEGDFAPALNPPPRWPRIFPDL